MYNTAKGYGLHVDSFVDERMDPIKSCEAAAKYLADAYKMFGDWNLAIASYNCGAGNVLKAIKRAGGSRKFWDIWPYLPSETRMYTPAFIGALYTLEYYQEHGLKPDATAMPTGVDTLEIKKQLHLKQVSEVTGAPLDVLKNLNPQYRHEIIPGHERTYILRIPYQYTMTFIELEDSIYRHKANVYFDPITIKKIKEGGDGVKVVYTVKSGDYLGSIAKKYNVSVAKIKQWNNLKSDNIRIGQKLVIYRRGSAPASTEKKSSSTSSTSTSSSTKQPSVVNAKGHTTYTVKSGDSFYSIAKGYPGVSAENIMDYNGMTSTNLKPGMTIKIPIL
jgi:membrane-bound lytic murein transglycosylase D